MASLSLVESNYPGVDVGYANGPGYWMSYRSTYSFTCPEKTDKLLFTIKYSWQGTQKLNVDWRVDTSNSNDSFTRLGRILVSPPSGAANNTWKSGSFTITVSASTCGLSYFAANTPYFLHLAGQYVDSGAPYAVFKNVANSSTVVVQTTTYTVTFNANRGSAAPSSQTKTKYKNLTLTSSLPTVPATTTDATYIVTFNYNGNGTASASVTCTKKTSYTFSKWNTKADGSGTNYSPGATYSTDADITLYAIYTPSTTTTSTNIPAAPTWPNTTDQPWTITFKYNNGASDTTSKPTRTAIHSFQGWKDSSGTSYTAGSSFTPTKTITITAVWQTTYTYQKVTMPSPTKNATTDTPYTITYDGNGGSVSKASDKPTRTTTYTLDGWYENASFTGTKRNAGTAYEITKTVTLYAKFVANTPTVASVNLPTASRTGYELLGFGTSKSQTTNLKPAGSSYTASASVTFYAIWKALGLVRIYDSNGTPNKYQCFIYTGTGPYDGWDLFAPYIGNGSQSGTGFDLITG